MADGNPFGGSFQGQQPPTDPFSMGVQGGGNPFGAPQHQQPQQQQFAYPPQQQQPSPYQQPMPPQGQPVVHTQQTQQQGYDPFSQAPPQQQSLQPPAGQYSNALVPSLQSSNPYAGMVAQTNNANNQYAAAPAANSYDPFAAPPASTSQAMVPVAPAENSPYPRAPPPQYHQQQQDIFGPPQQATPGQPQPPPPSPPSQQQEPPNEMVPAPSSGYPGAPRSPPRTPRNTEPTDKESETPSGVEARNKYSSALAQNAPLGASPLPRADMVRKTGYVLSRISFRTIVMKKWKQSFWVQYGPHTMLWFRSQADFDDWLNNPYHTQAQRNFLIKLAVNFAHDLYKPNVRGYQVTQCRTKNYGTKLIRQFKLERWMDYGPTIAAAFGSNNPKEVDDLREALVACMRNTPLNGGIRATGAVRERTDERYDRHDGAHGGERRPTPDEGYDNASYGGHPTSERPAASRSVASAGDVGNDQKGFDDAPSEHSAPDLLDFSEPPQQHQPPQHQTSFHSQPAYSQQTPQIQQNQFPGSFPLQQQQYGAPLPQQPQQHTGAPGQFPVQQHQPPYGAPPAMQQQQYGQPQAHGGY